MTKPKCGKCGKAVPKKGSHCVMPIDGPTTWYHWDCFDPEYNAKIEWILKDVHKNDKKI